MKKQTKDKLIGTKLIEADYNELKKVAATMDIDISKLIRLSVEPYLIKNRLRNSEGKLKENKLSGLAGLVENKKVFEYYEDELGTLLKDIKDKIRNIEDAEKMIQEYIGANQIDLSFAKVKQHF